MAGCKCSSGKGQSLVEKFEELEKAWDKALKDARGNSDKVIIEEYIKTALAPAKTAVIELAEKEIRAKEFKEANEAFDQKKYFFLLDIADKYRVSTPRYYDQQNRWMKRETEKIQGLISQKKNTYSYGFAEAETEEEKELLIRKFIFQLFRINV